jgi:hypothetical protein
MNERDIIKIEKDKLGILQQHLARFACPILIEKNKGRYVLGGSSVLLSNGGKKYIVTATHVVELINKYGSFMLDNFAKPFQIKLKFLAGISKNELTTKNDSVDVAIAEFDEEYSSLLADIWLYWPTEMCWERTKIDSMDIGFSIIGFPETKNRFRNTIHPNSYIALKNEVDVNIYFKYNIQPDMHIAFDFQDFIQFDADIPQQYNFPAPYGMSGGPVWRTVNFKNIDSFVEKPMLTGIIIEQTRDKKVVFCTKIQVATNGLKYL